MQSCTCLSSAGDGEKPHNPSQEDVMPLRKLNPPHLPPKLHSGCVYDRPGHVPPIQSETEAWVLRDGEVLEDMGVTELMDSCDSAKMSEVGFIGVRPGRTVQGHQKKKKSWQTPP